RTPAPGPAARTGAPPALPAARRADFGAGPRHHAGRGSRAARGDGTGHWPAGGFAQCRAGRETARRAVPASPAWPGGNNHMTPIPLSTGDLVLASLLIIAGAALSLAMSLDLHRTLLWAAVRMVMQLMLVGLALRAVFALSSPWVTLLVVI